MVRHIVDVISIDEWQKNYKKMGKFTNKTPAAKPRPQQQMFNEK